MKKLIAWIKSLFAPEIIFLDDEAESAYYYLQGYRKNYLYKDGKRKPLVRNKTLIQAAKDKAADMINRNYYGHVDPNGNGMNIKISQAGYYLPVRFIMNKKDNNFESIAPSLGVEAIDMLIASPEHVQHVLGLDFWINCVDCGIACVKSPSWLRSTKTYTVVLLTSHFENC